jgi:alkylation response protein AidB-like acyl-CoA dehydrogenase
VNFEFSEKTKDFRARIEAFMEELVYPNEATFHEQLQAADSRWSVPSIMEELKEEAKSKGLWNLFLPPRPSTATPRTQATWRCSSATAPKIKKSGG